MRTVDETNGKNHQNEKNEQEKCERRTILARVYFASHNSREMGKTEERETGTGRNSARGLPLGQRARDDRPNSIMAMNKTMLRRERR